MGFPLPMFAVLIVRPSRPLRGLGELVAELDSESFVVGSVFLRIPATILSDTPQCSAIWLSDNSAPFGCFKASTAGIKSHCELLPLLIRCHVAPAAGKPPKCLAALATFRMSFIVRSGCRTCL